MYFALARPDNMIIQMKTCRTKLRRDNLPILKSTNALSTAASTSGVFRSNSIKYLLIEEFHKPSS
jgi:hypothetical protein